MKITFQIEIELDEENYLTSTKISAPKKYRIEAIMEALDKIVADYKKEKELDNE